MNHYVRYRGKYYRDPELPYDHMERKSLYRLRGNTGIAVDPVNVYPAEKNQVKAIERWLHKAGELVK